MLPNFQTQAIAALEVLKVSVIKVVQKVPKEPPMPQPVARTWLGAPYQVPKVMVGKIIAT